MTSGNLLLVFCGGGAGAVLRYALQVWLGKPGEAGFPFATFTANLAGCLLIGIMAAMSAKMQWNQTTMLLVFTGILGGFTTFSSFALEFFSLLRNNHTGTAFLYMGLSNLGGAGLCATGYLICK